ncbi:MAG: choice-of-anchor J domain-containing protein, partial [Bacteroidales bacterium]|nr:choice-of-anchor J domain-containing protein [Bacteroidales bacterium]MCF8457678.1 choice-of-anchor J domain-containing protein [Bacteroidales bacterium]
MRIISYFLFACMLLSAGAIAQTTLPFVENFEGTPTASGWTVTAAPGSDGWTIGANQSSSFVIPIPGQGSYAMSSDESCVGCDKSADLLVSPALDLSGHLIVSLDFLGFYLSTSGTQGYVLISFDNGASWADTVHTMFSTGTWEDISIDLSAYVDDTINVGFLFNDPTPSVNTFGFAVDNVHVFEPWTYDVGIIGWTIPQTGCGLTDNESITIDIENLGLADASNITVSYSLDGGSNFVNEIIPGPITSGTVVNYTFSQKADLSVAAIYTIELAVAFTTDENLTNNNEGPFIIKSLSVIDQFPFTENFNSGSSVYFDFVVGSQAGAAFKTAAGNGYVEFTGAGFPASGWTGFPGTTTSSNAWNDNVSHHAYMNACAVDATLLSDLELQFDLDQKFVLNQSYTWFRLVVNGTPVADSNGTIEFSPVSNSTGYQTHTYDLTAFVGNMIDISFQGASLFSSQVFAPGNINLIDNISFTGTQTTENIYTLPFNENFEGGPTNPGWTTDQATGSDGWVMAAEYYGAYWYPDPLSNPNTTIAATSNDDICNCDASLDYLISPKLNLIGYGVVNLSFDYFFTGDYGSEGYVYVSTDGTLNNLTLIQTMPLSTNQEWQSVTVNLNAYIGSVVKLVFHHNDNGGSASGFSIDNVSVVEGGAPPVAVVYPLPFMENFEGQPTNTGWSTNQASGSDGWVMAAEYYGSYWYPDPLSSPNTTIAATSNDDICNCNSSADYFMSPILDLTNTATVELNFDYFFNGEYGSTGFVYVSTDGTLNNLQLIQTMLVSPVVLTWNNLSVDLSAFAGDSIQLVFLHSDNGGSASGFSIDNVSVTSTILPPPSVYTIPFLEDFEGQPTNIDWSTNQASGSDGWVMAAEYYGSYWYPNPLSNPNTTIAATSNDDICNCNSSADYFISPEMSLTGFNAFELNFDYFFNGEYGSTGFVYVSTDGTLNNLQLIKTMTVDPLVLIWVNTTVDLTAFAGDTIQLVFLHSDNGGSASGFSIDNVSVTGSNPAQIVYNLPFMEDFEGQPTNTGWSTSQAPGSDGWVMAAENYGLYWYPIPSSNTTIAATSNDDICVCDASVDYFISPPISFVGYSGVTLQMDYFFNGDYGSEGFVYVSLDGTLNNLQLVQTMPISSTTVWNNMSINLSSFVGDTVQIVFHHDDNGLDASGFSIDNVNVTGQLAPPDPIISGVETNVDCFGASTGAIDISVTSGVTPYTYLWSNNSTTQDLINVIADNYSVVVTDFVGATATASFVITEPADIQTTDAATICDGDTYIFGTQTLTTANTYTEVFASVDGCDSTVVLTLSVNPVYNNTDVA